MLMMKHGQGSWPGSLRRPGVSARGSAVLRADSRFLGEKTLEISGGAPRPGGERDRPSRWPGGQQSGARARADAHDALGTGTGAAGSKCMRDHLIERERARASARDGGVGGGRGYLLVRAGYSRAPHGEHRMRSHLSLSPALGWSRPAAKQAQS